MITLISQWSIGFNIITCLLLWCTYQWVCEAFDKSVLSRLACTAMLGTIAALQVWHGWALATGGSLFESRGYLIVLYCSTITFFAFYSTLITTDATLSKKYLALAALPLLGPLLPSTVAIPLAFLLGGLAAVWLIVRVRQHKGGRQSYEIEQLALAGITLAAFIIFLAAVVAPWWGERVYIITYANVSAMVFVTLLWMLMRYPDLLQKAVELVAQSYAKSTLQNENCDALAQKIEALMTEQALYTDDSLNLSKLAKALSLSNHQTSELVNTYFDMSVSRYISQHRVNAAKKMLLAEPDASVLSVGLAVGFSSQSTFYTAFKSTTQQTPKQYRTEHLS